MQPRYRRLFLWVAGFGTVAMLCSYAIWIAQAKRARRNASKLTGHPHEILPASGLYYLGADYSYSHSAAYALQTRDGIAVIDPGLRLSMIERAFHSLGLKLADVRIVLITHRHADHWFAARDLVSRSGAMVMAHELEVPVLTTAADLGQYYAHYPAAITEVPTLSTVRALRDTEVIRLGEAAIEVIGAPGHTPGSVCYRTVCQGKQVLWSGDAVVASGPAPVGGDYMTRIGPRFGGDMQSYLATLKRLQSIAVDILLPGHPAYSGNTTAFVNADVWRNLLEQQITRLKQWLDDYSDEVNLFLDGVPKGLGDGILYLGEAAGTATYLLESGAGLILVDPGRRDANELIHLMEVMGADPARLKSVLITTVHPDHMASADELRERTGAELYAAPRPEWPALCPTHALSDGERVQLGELTLTALDSGAGDLSFLVQVGSRLVLIGGDNVARFPLGPNEEYHEAARPIDLMKEASFYRKLKAQPVRLLLPAHPRFDEAPCYLPGEWEQRTRNF